MIIIMYVLEVVRLLATVERQAVVGRGGALVPAPRHEHVASTSET
jgi:hypothetical protein